MPGQRAAGIRLRGIPIDGSLWKAAQAAAAIRGESVSEVIRRGLRQYVDEVMPGSSPKERQSA
jgi:hypothetical protein